MVTDNSQISAKVSSKGYTNKALEGVQSIDHKLGLSVSQLWEKIGCGQLVVLDLEEYEDLLDTIAGLEGLLSAHEEGTISWEQFKAELDS